MYNSFDAINTLATKKYKFLSFLSVSHVRRSHWTPSPLDRNIPQYAHEITAIKLQLSVELMFMRYTFVQ